MRINALLNQTFSFVGISGLNFILSVIAYSLFTLSLSRLELGELAYVHISYLLGVTLSTVGFYKLILKDGLSAFKFTTVNDSKIFYSTIILIILVGIFYYSGLMQNLIFDLPITVFFILGILYPVATRPRALFEHRLQLISARLPALVSNIIAISSAIIIGKYFGGFFAYLSWRFLLAIFEMIWFGIKYYRINKIIESDNQFSTRDYWQFCLPVWGSTALVFVAGNIDYLIIGKYLTTSELGIYWLCFQYGNYLLQLRTLFITVLTPLFVKTNILSHRRLIFKIVLDSIFLIPLITVCFILIETEFLRNSSLGELGQSIEVFGLIMLGFVIRMYSSFLEVFAVTEKKSSILMVSATATSLFFVILLLVLIPQYGINGAVVAYLICSIIIFGYSVYIYTKYMGRNFICNNLINYSLKATLISSIMIAVSTVFGTLLCIIVFFITTLIILKNNLMNFNYEGIKNGRI